MDVKTQVTERYELRLSARELWQRIHQLPYSSRIVGASFQVGDENGHGDTVVLLIERAVAGLTI